jgi:cytochrome c553
MKVIRQILPVLAFFAALPVVSGAEDQVPDGEQLVVTAEELQAFTRVCESCHGPGGVSEHADTPTLAGRRADELVAAMEKFYFYERHCPTASPRYGDGTTGTTNMCEVTGRLNSRQMTALADYFASREVAPAEPGTGRQ